MRCIDLEDKLPTANDVPDGIRWTQAEWTAWTSESDRLVTELAKLDAAGKKKERNALIDANNSHWTKLRPWLLWLSHKKCWFSDVRELFSHPEVEHFRPKKEARGLNADVRDGYWWLAFNLKNFRISGNVGNRKKGGWFPLQEGSKRSTYDDQCEEAETAYLLDPIDSEDVDLLMFDNEGRVISRPNASEWEKQRVNETVKRLKLNEHAVLAEERRKIWSRVNYLADTYLDAVERTRKGGNEAARQKARDTGRSIREVTRPAAELSSVATCCVLLRNDPRLLKLLI